MNRLRRFILWGMTLAVLASFVAASFPVFDSLSKSNRLSNATWEESGSSSFGNVTLFFSESAVRSRSESSGTLRFEPFRVPLSVCEMPGCDDSVAVVDSIFSSGHNRCHVVSLRSLKTRWQI